jgi:hypothetical protein
MSSGYRREDGDKSSRLHDKITDLRITIIVIGALTVALGLAALIIALVTLPRVTKLENAVTSLLALPPGGSDEVVSTTLALIVPNSHPLVTAPDGTDVLLTKVGAWVTMEIGPYLGIIDNSTLLENEYFSRTPFVFTSLLPVAYRPVNEIYLPMVVKDQKNKSPGVTLIDTNGTVTINFAGIDQLNGWGVITIMYPCSIDCDAGVLKTQVHWQTEL